MRRVIDGEEQIDGHEVVMIIAKRLGITLRQARRMLRKAIDSGELVPAGERKGDGDAGNTQ